MKPNQEVRALSSKFGLRVKQMKVIQNGVYKITTSNGKIYCLKRMAYPPARLRWIDTTLRRIRKHGFPQLVWRDPSHYAGKRLFVKWFYHSPPFVIHPWVKGSWPSPNSRSHMKACGAYLARFHQSGKRIAIPRAGRNNGMGTWHSYLINEMKVLRKVILKAKRNGFHNRLDRMLQAHGQQILRMGEASLKSLRNSNYRAICRKAKATLCHGDCGPTNIIRAKNGLRFIDFETLRLDLRSYDLYRMIYNSCYNHGWKFTTAKSILEGYEQVSRLTIADYRLLFVWLRFPRGVCKLFVHYEQKPLKEKWEIVRDFPRFFAAEHKRQAMLKRLESYVKNRYETNKI